MRALIVHLCLAASVALGVQTALAQEAPAEPGAAAEEAARPAPPVLEEVRVTARKKAVTEAVQDVPISVSAFTGSYLEENFVENLTDIGRSAPNVQLSDVGTFPGTANFSLRGNAIFSSIISDEPKVGIFVDGIYAGMNVSAIHDLFELEAVEILRGPQGTLFGRNVTGGAINVRTRRPSGEFGIRGRAIVGSYSRSDASLSVEAPLGETLAWKVDLLTKDRDGMFDTPFLGGKQGHERSWAFRPMFNWRPTDNLEIFGLYEVLQFTGDGNINRVASGAGLQSTGEIGNFDLQNDFRGKQGFKVQRATVEANWDVGAGTLTSITGWRHIRLETTFDVDGTPLDFFQGGPFRKDSPTYQHQISSELRYNTALGERADITAGAYYFKQDLDYRENRFVFVAAFPPGSCAVLFGCPDSPALGEIGQPIGSPPIGGVFGGNRGELDHQSVAFFAQGDYDLTDRLTATLGARWTWEEKVAVIFPSDLFNSLCNANFTECVFDSRRRDDQDTWNYWSRHAGLRYQVNEDLLVYGTYTRSFRAGGFNLRASATIPFSPYGEERIDAYEVGLKGDWLDRTLRTNLSAFYNRGDDIQATILVGVVQDQKNAAKAHVAGVEAEIWWLPIEGLTLNTTVGWVDAEYDNFSGVCSGTQTVGPCAKAFGMDSAEIPPGVGRELEFAYIPEWTFSALARYELPVPALGDGTLALQASVYWRDNTFGNDQNTVPIDSYTLWDAAISYRSPDDRYTVSVFGKNLTQDPYHDFGTDFVSLWGSVNDWNPGPPRTFGVEVGFNY